VAKTMTELDAAIESFFSRPLGEQAYPYVLVDARYEKVRKHGRVRSQAVLIAAGVREDGRRDLLALALGDSESQDTWGELFAGLKRRGLRGVELLVSDAHRGIRSAAEKHFQGAAWQRCRVHFMREMMGKVSFKNYHELAADLRSIYASEEREQCLAIAGEVAGKWEGRSARLARALREGVEDTLTVWDYGRKRRRKLNSTNMIERLMKEIKKRTRVIGSFPNEQSCWRLVGAVLLETQDAWDMEDKRYIVFDD
jgi:transposase-like protein